MMYFEDATKAVLFIQKIAKKVNEISVSFVTHWLVEINSF